MKRHSHYIIILRVCIINLMWLSLLSLFTGLEALFVRLFFKKLLFFSPFPLCALWKKVTLHSLYLRSRELYSTNLRREYLHKLFIILLHTRFVYFFPFIYLIIYLYQYVLMDICFLLWVIIQYYFVYCVAQIVPVLAIGRSFSWPLGPLDILPSLCGVLVCLFVWTSFFLALHNVLNPSVCFLPSLRSINFSKELWFLLLKNAIRNKDLSSRCAYCSSGVIISTCSQLAAADKSINTHISINISICKHLHLY